MKPNSWVPVRYASGIYCSPACGANCTFEAYLDAHKRANSLAADLGGTWTPRVWENYGWHWSVEIADCDPKATMPLFELHESEGHYTLYVRGPANFTLDGKAVNTVISTALKRLAEIESKIVFMSAHLRGEVGQ